MEQQWSTSQRQKDSKNKRNNRLFFFLSFFSFRITEQTERDVVRKDKEETSRYILAHRYSLNARYQDRKTRRGAFRLHRAMFLGHEKVADAGRHAREAEWRRGAEGWQRGESEGRLCALCLTFRVEVFR